MKKIITFFFCIGCMLAAKADHITGGEMYYTYAGITNGEYQYNVVLKLFMRCNSGRFFSDPTIISVFDRITGEHIKDISAPLGNQENLNLSNTNPCITDPPTVCYVVGYFYFRVSLPASANGYLLSSQVNYRVTGINNLGNYNQVGATYTTEIPGNIASVTDAPANNSAHFTGNDLVIICENNSFSYSFGASDADGDQLRYSFCNAYAGGNGGTPGNSQPASNPPYVSVPYGFPNFSSAAPLGSRVQIDAGSGLITGIAPTEGKYVVTVCVEEIRNGIVIAIQRKDLQINIASCTIAAATLLPQYAVCKDIAEIMMTNLSTSPLIKSYNWQLVNPTGAVIFNSTAPTASYVFTDTGTYVMKLSINKDDLCSDSSSAPVKVYPGFKPQFTSTGICINKPTIFKDATTSVYGTVNSRDWDFGENIYDDFSDLSNPSYTYTTLGIKNVRLIVTDSKGCVDTLMKEVGIVDKPSITMAFRDSLICLTDKVQLLAGGSGNFTWTPLVNILNAGSAAPTVSPALTTTYFADLDDNGCKNRDSVNIRVVDHVNLQAMADTTICSTDSTRLHVISDGLKYSWKPAAQFVDPGLPNAIAITNTSTLYEVTASIGSCSSKDQVLITAVPYPVASAGADTVICFNTNAQLHGTIIGKSFVWAPSNSLNSAGVLNPIARPARTTAYILLAYDTRGCPKPGVDTVLVKMLPDINAFAGNDTTIVTNQPLQLHASGGIKYLWTPSENLSAADTADPIAVIMQANSGLRYKVMIYNEANCADSAFIKVKVYKTLPSVFVPNAFTPNGDGKNDILRPVAVGILRIEYFNVYNRWGQLVFSNTDPEAGGWNGRLAGKEQAADAYVWVIKALDYNGKEFNEKGVVLLIR
ncbi:MAG: gliding motility-associated C-terminal domain-containing protein [Bacteroidota bacterium]